MSPHTLKDLAAELDTPSEEIHGHHVSTGRAVTILMIGVVALAFSGILVKESNFEPATSAFLRCFLAFGTLVPFAIWEVKNKGWLSKPGVILSIVAGLFLGVDFTAWNYSIFYVGAGIASVLLNLQIIIMPMLAIVFDKYRAERTFWLVVPVMIIGVVLTGGVLNAAPSEGPAKVYGMDIAILGTLAGSTSGVCYSVYLYASRKATVVNIGKYVQPMVWVFAAQLVPPVIFMFITGRGFDITHGVLVDGKLPMNPETTFGDPITGMSWFWMIVLAITGQAMAWLFVQYGLVNLDPTIGAGLLLLSPVSTVAFIAPFTHGEIPQMLQWLGVVIVLAAVAYQNKLHAALINKFRAEDESESAAKAENTPGP